MRDVRVFEQQNEQRAARRKTSFERWADGSKASSGR
jgi:hypothetical protein